MTIQFWYNNWVVQPLGWLLHIRELREWEHRGHGNILKESGEQPMFSGTTYIVNPGHDRS